MITLQPHFLLVNDFEVPARTLDEADVLAKTYLTYEEDTDRIDVFNSDTNKLVARYDKEADGQITVWRR